MTTPTFKNKLAIHVRTREEHEQLTHALMELGYRWSAISKDDFAEYPFLCTYFSGSVPGLGYLSEGLLHNYQKSTIILRDWRLEDVITLASKLTDGSTIQQYSQAKETYEIF